MSTGVLCYFGLQYLRLSYTFSRMSEKRWNFFLGENCGVLYYLGEGMFKNKKSCGFQHKQLFSSCQSIFVVFFELQRICLYFCIFVASTTLPATSTTISTLPVTTSARPSDITTRSTNTPTTESVTTTLDATFTTISTTGKVCFWILI